MQASFEDTKHALTSHPVLIMPHYSKPFEVLCDAYVSGVGVVLLQEGRPIAHESKKVLPAEVDYTTGEQGLLAVVHAMRSWRLEGYLEGSQWSLITN